MLNLNKIEKMDTPYQVNAKRVLLKKRCISNCMTANNRIYDKRIAEETSDPATKTNNGSPAKFHQMYLFSQSEFPGRNGSLD